MIIKCPLSNWKIAGLLCNIESPTWKCVARQRPHTRRESLEAINMWI